MDNTLYLLIASYGSSFNEVPSHLASAPGRVNLIGEHTDYNEGFVLPMAIGKRTYVVARTMYGDLVRARSVGFEGVEEFSIGDLIQKKQAKKGVWSDYVMGVANEFIKGGYKINGFWALFKGYVPIGSGLSSSAALEIASALLIGALFGHEIKYEDIVRMARSAEEEFVGVRCGVMDQMTGLFAKEGNAMFIDCRDMSYTHIPVNTPDSVFLVVDTGIKRELGSSVYNDRRRECEEAADAIKKDRPDVKSLRDAKLDDIEKIKGKVKENILKRARHIITENDRVLVAKDLLGGGKLSEFGELMYKSHDSLKSDYEVSCPELDLIVDVAKGVKGVFGARMTGGGFGGSAIALIEKKAQDDFEAKIKEAFAEKELDEPKIYPVYPSEGAKVEKLELGVKKETE